MSQSYFIIGTDTNVGKTYIASALVKEFVGLGFKTIGMKPVASGCQYNKNHELINEDVTALMKVSNVTSTLDVMNPYRFIPAIAPHIAAEQAGVSIDLEVIANAYQMLTRLAEVVIVEGAGGLLVPLNATQTLADLVKLLNIPIILVVGMRLGCINHALLTIELIKARGLTLAGWVANEIDPTMNMFEDNLSSLQQRISAPCLGVVRWQGQANFTLAS